MFRPEDEPDLVSHPHPSPETWDPDEYLPARVIVEFDTLDIWQPGDIEWMVVQWINKGLREEQETNEDWEDYEEYPLPGAKVISAEYIGVERVKPELSDKGFRILGEDFVEQVEDWLEEE